MNEAKLVVTEAKHASLKCHLATQAAPMVRLKLPSSQIGIANMLERPKQNEHTSLYHHKHWCIQSCHINLVLPMQKMQMLV